MSEHHETLARQKYTTEKIRYPDWSTVLMITNQFSIHFPETSAAEIPAGGLGLDYFPKSKKGNKRIFSPSEFPGWFKKSYSTH